jgi:tetratricopeptide (TPR) repeat protein
LLTFRRVSQFQSFFVCLTVPIRRPYSFLAVFIVAILIAGCARESKPAQPRRIAVLRFENLSGDPSIAWQGRALSEIVSAELGGARGLQVLPSSRLHAYDRVMGVRALASPGISAESSQALAAGANQLAYGQYTVRNGRLEAQVTLEDARPIKAAKLISVSVPAGDVLGAADSIARQISPQVAPYGTRNPQALAAYIRALESGDPAVMEVGLNVAISADPDFSPPYLLLAEYQLQRQDRAAASATIERALARKTIPELERACLQLLSAGLSGSPEARQQALANLSRLDSADPGTWRALGETALARHDYRTSLQAYRKALELEPDDPALLNQVGYAAAFNGDLDAAMTSLRRYQALHPNEANPLDSTGDVNFLSGKLADAEDFYLQASKKDPAFNNHSTLLKAALARLLTGDAPGANNLAERFLQARADAKDPVVDYRRAEWYWLSGRRMQAGEEMERFALKAEPGPLREAASRAYAQLSIWSTMMGDRENAARLAQKAISIAGPISAGNAILARFFSLPPATTAEWTVRAGQQFPAPQQSALRNIALSYALLVNKQFQPAQSLLQQMWDSGVPSPDEALPVLLAWSDLETGRVSDAAALLRTNPVPSAAGLTPYTGFYIPRLLYLRGLLAEKENRQSEARAYYDKFLAISGPDPLMWGEEKRVARQ